MGSTNRCILFFLKDISFAYDKKMYEHYFSRPVEVWLNGVTLSIQKFIRDGEVMAYKSPGLLDHIICNVSNIILVPHQHQKVQVKDPLGWKGRESVLVLQVCSAIPWQSGKHSYNDQRKHPGQFQHAPAHNVMRILNEQINQSQT
jgi:hypothetical protein